MADVDNSVGAIYQRRTRSGSETDKISPSIKDAMDRIFPKSPSKFLQNPFQDSHDMRLEGNKLSSSRASVSGVLNVKKSFACTVSNAHITTDTTTTATAIFTNLSISTSGTKSPIMSFVPSYSNDMPSLPAPAIVNNNVSLQNGNCPSEAKVMSKAKINRAELQMCIQAIEESPTSTISEKLCSDSDVTSQSEASRVKEKKRRKKRKKERQEETGLKDSTLNYTDCTGNGYSHSQSNSLTNGEVISSSDAVIYPSPVKVKQKLPKVVRILINIDKDAKYIQRKFLPCFVVLKKASANCAADDNDLNLQDRVNHLTDQCIKNRIDCPKFKSLQYRNIFEECVIQNSEDEFISPRGRSLRKRNTNVSYIEPSEDDLLEDFSSFSKKKKAQNKSAIDSQQKVEDQKKNEGNKEMDNANVVSEAKNSDNDRKDKTVKKKSHMRAEQKDAAGGDSSKTVTSHTAMKDDKGRSVVIVYPKTKKPNATGIRTSINSDGKTISPKKRIGPASKTNQPLNLPPSSLSTLSLPRSLLGGNIAVRNMVNTVSSPHAVPPLIQPPLSTTSTISPPQFYMVKIDGKDFLVPLMAGTPPRLGVPGLAGTSSVLTRVSTPNMAAQSFAVPRMPSVMIPGMTAGVRMISPGLSTSNILSTVPLIGNPHVATSCLAVNNLSQIGLNSNRPSHLIPTSLVANTVSRPSKSSTLASLVSTPIATPINLASSISQSVLTSKSVAPGISTLVAPLAAPASTTVLRSTRPRAVTASSSPIVTSNASATGNRCFRIIVPGCSAAGIPARIATLGSQANSSPLSHMALSSSLLPQRKRSVESDMSAEKRAAKRRRLETKYPIPPGVVIKTEPDEPPKVTTSTIQAGSVRSLLGQNIQLITSAAKSGSSLQNIRLVTPFTGSRQMRLGSNFIIRTPTSSTVNWSSGSAVSASSLIVSPSTQGNSSAIRTLTSTTVPSLTTASNSITTMAVTRSTTTTASNLHSTSTSNTSDRITTLSYSVSSINAITCSSTSKAPTSTSPSSLKESIAGLRKLITTQENVGLKGPRLDKLKELLAQKEKVLAEQENEQTDSEIVGGVTASDPVVID